jgi:hypothetical protein
MSKAFRFHRHGGPDVLQFDDLEIGESQRLVNSSQLSDGVCFKALEADLVEVAFRDQPTFLEEGIATISMTNAVDANATILSQRMYDIMAPALIAAAKDQTLIRKFDPLVRDLEGYLFPETYRVTRHTEAPALVRQMVARFEHVFSPELRRAAEQHGLSIHQLVVLASHVDGAATDSAHGPAHDAARAHVHDGGVVARATLVAVGGARRRRAR